jgi:hypothetical protein
VHTNSIQVSGFTSCQLPFLFLLLLNHVRYIESRTGDSMVCYCYKMLTSLCTASFIVFQKSIYYCFCWSVYHFTLSHIPVFIINYVLDYLKWSTLNIIQMQIAIDADVMLNTHTHTHARARARESYQRYLIIWSVSLSIIVCAAGQ